MSEPAPAPRAPAPTDPSIPARPAVQRHRVLALGLAVFTSGAVLLGLEIAASRVVAPFFGNSLFVWGALIGVVLTGLSIGYYVGGALADRLPSPWLLAAVMTLGALLVLAIPAVDDTVLEWIVRWDPGPRLDPLVAAIALFGLPSIVFAAVTPIAVRLSAHSLATLGRTSGRLFAISTAGSIFGTFATAFVLIPEYGTNQLLGIGAAVMLAMVAVYSAAERLWLAGGVAVVLAVVAGFAASELAPSSGGRLSGVAARNYSPVYRTREEAGVGADVDYRAQGFDVRFRKDTRYHGLAVVDDDETRYLRFDNSFQSGMWLDRPYATRFEYTDYFDLGLAYNPGAKNVLFVGLGGGSAPKRFWRDFPNLDLQVVELDPVVADVAYEYFHLPRSPRLDVEIEDGRRFLTKDDREWDVIALDTFYADSIPFHMATLEFLDVLRSRLAPGGVVVVNTIGSIRGSSSRLFRSLYKTYATEFPSVVVHPVAEPGYSDDSLSNLMVVATDAALPSEEFLQLRWNAIRERARTAPDLTKAIRNRHEGAIPLRDVPVLTDDYAPTDALLLIE
jgi:spermidine synthase/MFS family permease